MRLTHRLLTALACFGLFMATATAQEFSSLEERMSGSEFREAGLEKLSAEELDALNRWLRGNLPRVAAAATPQAGTDSRGLRLLPSGPQGDIVSTIPGNFRGFTGAGQRFELENGQVWVATESRPMPINVNDPKVTISEGMLGAWFIRVDGYNTQVRVRRER